MSTTKILIVHPDADVISLMTSMLQTLGHRIVEATDDRAALKSLEQERGEIDLVLAGVDPFDPDALELLTYVRRKYPKTKVILVFPHPHADRSRDAIRRGASATLKFPVPATQLRAAVAQALGQREESAATPSDPRSSNPPNGPGRLPNNGHGNGNGNGHGADSEREGEPAAWGRYLASSEPTEGGSLESETTLIGDDPSLRQALELAERIAATRAPVLILGERGTGKSLVATILHQRGTRSEGPFVEVSCASMKESALEVDLFGRKGYGFPDLGDKSGKIAQAKGGTLFLDEVSALSPELQFKLQRVLQEGGYEPVGSTQTFRADCRIILGSREDLATLVEEGRFRQDLFYRMSVVTLKLPPLRHRRGDIIRLAEHFRVRLARKLNKEAHGFTPEAIEALRSHDWPGNVHELRSAVERGIALSRTNWIEAAHLGLIPAEVRGSKTTPHTPKPHLGLGIRPLKEALEEPEKQIILQALQALNWNRQETARVLDINRTTLYKKMKKYNLIIDEPTWVG